MKQILLVLALLTISNLGYSQGNWSWTRVADLPITTSNNAFVEVISDNGKFAYSFGGISDSLTQSDIHQRVFKYSVSQDSWTEMPEIPDTSGKIASAASFVNDKIYLIGGYHVESNGTETSSNKIHIYDPSIDAFEADGSSLPIPIDDHVQAVWRDSLIFVVTGWSNTENVPDVQIYNPELNSWMIGTPTPNLTDYKSFGASGYILGDTIFYYGGVIDNPIFEATNTLRKGVIDEKDPTQIEWTVISPSNGDPLYRAACSGHNKVVFWLGGSKQAYNFNALAYYTDEPVLPNNRTINIDLENNTQSNTFNTQNEVMDLRGIAKIGGGNWLIAGGIDSLQKATNKTYLAHKPELSDINTLNNPPFFKVVLTGDYFKIMTENIGEIIVYDIQGRTLFQSNKQLADLKIPKSELQQGILLFVYDDKVNLPLNIKKVNP